MADAFIYDHVRTPRGRGKKDGSLHEVPPVLLKVVESIANGFAASDLSPLPAPPALLDWNNH